MSTPRRPNEMEKRLILERKLSILRTLSVAEQNNRRISGKLEIPYRTFATPSRTRGMPTAQILKPEVFVKQCI